MRTTSLVTSFSISGMIFPLNSLPGKAITV